MRGVLALKPAPNLEIVRRPRHPAKHAFVMRWEQGSPKNLVATCWEPWKTMCVCSWTFPTRVAGLYIRKGLRRKDHVTHLKLELGFELFNLCFVLPLQLGPKEICLNTLRFELIDFIAVLLVRLDRVRGSL